MRAADVTITSAPLPECDNTLTLGAWDWSEPVTSQDQVVMKKTCKTKSILPPLFKIILQLTPKLFDVKSILVKHVIKCPDVRNCQKVYFDNQGWIYCDISMVWLFYQYCAISQLPIFFLTLVTPFNLVSYGRRCRGCSSLIGLELKSSNLIGL